MNGYGEKYLSWNLNTTIEGTDAMGYSGPGKDAVGVINVIAWVDSLLPNFIRGWDALGGGGGGGVTRHWYYDASTINTFESYPDISNCAKFCNITFEQVMYLLEEEGAPGLKGGYCNEFETTTI